MFYMFFNRNFDECLHLFKSSDHLLSVVALSDISIQLKYGYEGYR